MTGRQSDVFKFLKEYIAAHDYSPTYEVIAGAMGLKSLATIHKHLHCLKAEGRITISPTRKQAIEIVAEPAATGRFEFEGDRLWDKKLMCYWVREKEAGK